MPDEEFRAFFEQYSRRVLGVAARILGNAADAQDVHQEVFLAIWRRWDTYDGQTNWGAYLYRTTVRKALELAKRSRSRRSVRAEPELTINREAPDSRMRAAELHERLALGLARLPKDQAMAFVLSRLEGLASEEAAQVLGCSRGALKVRLHRATRRLARELSDYLVE